MMPDLDRVLNVLERHYPAAQSAAPSSLGLSWWEEMFEDLDNSFPEFGTESFKDEMWVRLADGASSCFRDVGAEHDIVQREGDGWAVREMGHGQCCGRTAVFMQENNVRKSRGESRVSEVGHDQVSTIQANRCRQEQTDFFGKCAESRGWVSRCRDEDSRVDETREMRVFRVESEFVRRASGGLRSVIGVVGLKSLVRGNRWI